MMMWQWLGGLTIGLFCLGEGELLAADKYPRCRG